MAICAARCSEAVVGHFVLVPGLCALSAGGGLCNQSTDCALDDRLKEGLPSPTPAMNPNSKRVARSLWVVLRWSLALALMSAATGVTFAQSKVAPAPLGASSKAPVYEVYAIQYGTIPNFKVSGLINGADTSRRLDIAMMVWLIKAPDGRNILLDAGFQRADLIARWKPTNFELPSVAVTRAGVKAEDISDVIISHIHWDHFDGAELFPNAKIWMQRDEYEHHVDSTGKVLDRAIDAPDAAMLHRLFVAGRLKLVDGDAREIIPGITLYTGGKHTFQSQYAGVHTADGTVVLASDNAYLYENFETHRPIAQTLDTASNMAAQRRMLTIASKPSLIVPGHDPQVMTRFVKVAPGVVRIR